MGSYIQKLLIETLFICTGQPKFVCKICGKSYTTRRGMRTHMQYHSTERPHRCETCNAAFKVRSKLRDHVRLVHTHVVSTVFVAKLTVSNSGLVDL